MTKKQIADCMKVKPDDILFTNFSGLYLVKMAQKETASHETESEEDNKEIKRMFVRDRFFARHACNVYKPTNEMTKEHIADCMKVKPDDILFKDFTGGVDEEHPDPNFVLFVDHAQSSIVLSIQGTSTINDIITDLTLDDEPFLDGVAHKGFFDASESILEKCSGALMNSLRNNPGYNVVVCGHSLGGSISVLTAMKLQNNYPLVTLPPGVSVRCVALAPAPMYRSNNPCPQNILDTIHIYVNDKDVVPHLCFGSLAKLLKILRVVDDMELTDEMQLMIIKGDSRDYTGELELKLVEIREAVAKSEQDQIEYLQHVGRVIHLVNKDGIPQLRCKGDNDSKMLASTIVIHDNMVGDHSSDKYLDMFTSVFTR